MVVPAWPDDPETKALLTATEITVFTLKNNDMRRPLLTLILLLSAAVFSSAQTGTWSGKLDLQSTKLALVFHLDGDNPTMDSTDPARGGDDAP